MKPLNFCDIRTGQMRGSPARLIRVLEWITSRPSLRVVLVNIFAGITDLARIRGPAGDRDGAARRRLRVPVVARLVGRGAADARRILAERQPDMFVTEDLEEACGGSRRSSESALDAAHFEEQRVRTMTAAMLGTLSHETQVIVQGITGRMGRTHAALMRAYGTNIVGGTSTRTDMPEAAGVPVFADCARGRAATGAVAIGGDGAADGNAGRGAGGAGRRHQADRHGRGRHSAARRDRASAARCDAPARPGSAGPRPAWRFPGEIKLGFLPDVCLRPGPLAIMSKSGTLSYEAGYRLAREGLGQSIWIGVGGDPVKGVRFADLLPVFFADPRTARHRPGRRSRRHRGRGLRRCAMRLGLRRSRSMR